jgi:hypothetical protein
MSSKLFLSIMITAALVVPAAADITGTSGQVAYNSALTIPSNLDLNQVESNALIRVFDEQQVLTLNDPLFVDIAMPGTYNEVGDLVGASGTIPGGTAVNSYLIHVDPLGSGTTLVSYSGSITFSNPILGVIVQTDTLNNTDGIPGAAPGTTYYTGVNRGLEWTNQDEVILSLSMNTLTLSLKAANILDNIRVIEAVPVPAAVLIGILGLGVAGLKLRKYV